MLIASPNVTAAVAAAEAAAAAAAASAAAASASATLAASYAGSEVEVYETKAAVEVATIPSALQFVRTAGYSSAGDFGGALYIRVVSEPTHEGKIRSTDRYLPNGTTDATNGGWWELKENPVTIEMFGGVADWDGATGTDNTGPMNAALTYSQLSIGSTSRSVPEIRLNRGQYYFLTANFQIKSTVRITGCGGHMALGNATLLRFPANVQGFTFHRYNTIEDDVESPTTKGADGSIMSNLYLWVEGASEASTDATAHGIQMRCAMMVDNCNIENFGGNGIHIDVTSGGSVSREGNANRWVVRDTRVQYCLHGIYVNGADCNAGNTAGCDLSFNRGWGLNDSSFLGNTHIGNHYNTNGRRGRVSHGGNRYRTRIDDLTGLVEPGVTAGWETTWELIGAGGTGTHYPAWVSGTAYYLGGPFTMDSSNAGGTHIGGYVEDSLAPCLVDFPNSVIGGIGIPVATGCQIEDGDIRGFDTISANYFNQQEAAGANYDAWWAWNETEGNNRLVDLSLYSGSIAGDGAAKRGAGQISAYIANAANGHLRLNYWNAATSAFVAGAQLDGDNLTFKPATDATLSLGLAAARWKKLWVKDASFFPASSITVTTPGEVGLEFTADGELTIRANGSDDVSRNVGFSLTSASAQTNVTTDADFTLSPKSSSPVQRHTGTLTADRAVTLDTTGANENTRFRITRTGAGAFNLNVGTGPLAALRQNEWADFAFDGTNWYLAASGPLTETLQATATVDPASIATGASTATATVTVTGAALGDIVKAAFSLDLAGAALYAWVSATNTVSYYFTNHNGANPLDLGSGTLKVRVEK